MKELLSKPLPVIPAGISEKPDRPGITLTPFGNKNDVLTNPALQQEVGFSRFQDGS